MNKIRKIKLFGERNSGTRYLEKLIELNLDVEILPGSVPQSVHALSGRSERVRDLYFSITYRKNLGWKHAMAPSSDQLKRLEIDGILFITLTKNPYAWLLSLERRPYHQKQATDSFAQFLQTEWRTVGRENHAQAFPNPIVMWNEKNRSYLGLNHGACVQNLRYEDLINEPATAISDIARTFSIARKDDSFINQTRSTKSDSDKGFDKYRTYYLEEQWRSEFDPTLLALINPHLDGDLMKRFRYELVC